MPNQKKQFNLAEFICSKKALVITVVAAFLSSFAFTVGELINLLFYNQGEDSTAGAVVSSILFWLFLVVDVVLLLLSIKQKVKLGKSSKKLHKKISLIALIVFLIFLIAFLIFMFFGNTGTLSLLGMMLLSFTLFSLYIVLIIKSNLFKNILLEGKEIHNE